MGSPHPCAAQRGPSEKAVQHPYCHNKNNNNNNNNNNTSNNEKHYYIYHKLTEYIDKVATLRRKGMLGKLKRKITLTKHNSKPTAHSTSENKARTTKTQTKEKWQRESIRIARINIRGINSTYKRQRVERWAEQKSIKILVLTETQHPYSTREGGRGKTHQKDM